MAQTRIRSCETVKPTKIAMCNWNIMLQRLFVKPQIWILPRHPSGSFGFLFQRRPVKPIDVFFSPSSVTRVYLTAGSVWQDLTGKNPTAELKGQVIMVVTPPSHTNTKLSIQRWLMVRSSALGNMGCRVISINHQPSRDHMLTIQIQTSHIFCWLKSKFQHHITQQIATINDMFSGIPPFLRLSMGGLFSRLGAHARWLPLLQVQSRPDRLSKNRCHKIYRSDILVDGWPIYGTYMVSVWIIYG